jgi:surface antigen
MRLPLSLCAVVLCATYATQSYADTVSPPTVQSQAQAPAESGCREFTATVTIGGQQQQAVGQACLQADGSWQVTQNTPGFPQLAYTLPPQAIYAYPYPAPYYWDPWFYGPPFFVGGSVFFADGFHRFHHGGGFRRDFPHRGFAHGGFAHGGFHGGHR